MNFYQLVRRIGLVIATMFVIGACVDAPQLNVGETTENVVSTDLSAYPSGQNIVVTFSGMNGSTSDWIAISLTTDPDNTYEVWKYTGGGAAGSVTFTAPTLTPGTYEARAYYDWANTSSYTVQQRSASFTITGAGPTVSTDKLTYSAGQTVTLSYANLPGNALDWVAVAASGSPATSVIKWFYTNGQVSGTQAFTGLAPGSYEARAYLNDSFSLVATSTFTIAGNPAVTTDKPTYLLGQTVTLSYSALPGNAFDWVAVAAAGSPATSVIKWFYTNGQVNGAQAFTGLAVGNYEARAYVNDTFTLLASSTFSIGGANSPTVTTDATSYTLAQPVTVTFANFPPTSTDWISISEVGSPDTSLIAWVYTGGTASGSKQFSNLPAGTYEARGYVNDTYTVIARSASFTVAGATCTPPAQAPVFGSLTSGDLVIDGTLQEATAALTVPLASSILFTSLNEIEASPQFGGVECDLHDVDAILGLPAGITCRRANSGTDTAGSTGQISIHWTVVTFTSGVSVQRGIANTGFTNPSAISLTAVDATQSFVLLGGIITGGTGWGNNEFVRARLVDGSNLDIRTTVAGSRVSWQVVTMVGASVQRGTTTLGSALLQRAVTVTAAPSGSLVLASYTTDNPSSTAASSLMLQSSLASATSIDFRRSLGGPNLDVSWEVVSLPFATRLGVTNFASGETALSSPVTGIVASSSVALASTQSVLGQATGSTTYNGAAVDLLGEAAATLTTGAGTVSVARATGSASASIPWAVIDFAHNCAGL